MSAEKIDKHEFQYSNEDRAATQKDLKILSLELKIEIEQRINSLELKIEQKINSVIYKLGTLIVGCSGILFGLFSYFHK